MTLTLFDGDRLAATLILISLLGLSTGTSGQTDSNKTVEPTVAAEVEQATRNFYAAISRGDGSQIDSFIANDARRSTPATTMA